MFFFRDVIGHDALKASLIRSVQMGNIAHAQLFAGPEGAGEFALAMAYARYVQCTNRGETDACGECASCRQYDALSHGDLHFVFPMVRSKEKHKVHCDDYLPAWSEFIRSNAYFGIEGWLQAMNAENKQAIIYADESEEIWRKMTLKARSSDYKVMVIWLPERMNVECANKLLKLLEEPYPNTLFLLVSNAPDELLATIRSRVQLVAVHALPLPVIADALQQQYGISETDARSVANLSGGSYLKATSDLMLNDEKQHYFDLFVQVMRLAYGRRIKELKAWSEEAADLGRERLRRFLTYAGRMIRENYIYNLGHSELNYMTADEANFSSRFAPFINERNVLEIMQVLSDAEKDVGQNANAKIVMFDLCIRLIMLLKQ